MTAVFLSRACILGIVEESVEEQSSRKLWWISLGLAGVVSIAIIVVLAVTSGGSQKKGPLTLTQVQPVSVAGDRLPAFVVGSPDEALGRTVPRVDGSTFGSRPITVKPGKPTMIVVIEPGSTGPDDLAFVNDLVVWHHADLTPAKLNVITIVTGPGRAESKDPASTWLVRAEWPWPVLVDDEAGSAATALGIVGTPSVLLVDADGVVRYREHGVVPAVELAKLITERLGV